MTLLLVSVFLFAEYRIAPNDTISVEFKLKNEFSTKQPVTQDGFINLPLVKMIKVSGMTQAELQNYLEKEYQKYIANDAPLIFVEPRPIYIIWHDLKDDSVETKIAKTPDEARALCGNDYNGEIVPGQVIKIDHGRPQSWWENNWYKLVSALALVISIFK
jgi:hypothetical protein